jgi:hypothetical protein
MNKSTRDRQRPLKVWVSPEERHVINARAEASGLAVSAYLRTAGLGMEPKSLFDQDAILALVKLHADQGRLGGLLKLWLATRPGTGASTVEVRALLKQIEQLQQQLQDLVKRL